VASKVCLRWDSDAILNKVGISTGEALLSHDDDDGRTKSIKNKINNNEAAAGPAKPGHRQKRKAKRKKIKVQMLDDEVEEMTDMHSLDGSVDSQDSVSQSSQSLNSEHDELKRINEKLTHTHSYANSFRDGRDTERKPKLDAKSSDDKSNDNSNDVGFKLKFNKKAKESKEQHDDETLTKAARRQKS